MAKRQFIYTIPSEKVQGKGSYVKVRSLLWGDAKRIRRELKDADEDEQMAANDQLLIDHIVEWDWVDEHDQPMPIPKDDPTVIDRLSAQEVNFLGDAVNGSLGIDEKKVSAS